MSATHKSECPAATGQNVEQSTNTRTVSPATNLDKQYATQQARCALAGVSLHRLENDHGNTVYIVSRWALSSRRGAGFESTPAKFTHQCTG